MLEPIFIRRKIKLIQEDLKHLEAFRELTFDEVAGDWTKWNALEWALAKIIGRAIDINSHIIAEVGGRNIIPPKDYTETFLLLKQLDVLPDEFTSQIARSAGFRNRIIHEYNDIKKDLVYKTVGEAIEQYLQYCAYILNYLEREKGGFSALGVLIAITTVLLIGGGFLVYQYQGIQGVKPKPSTPVSPALSTSPQPSPAVADISDWKTYRNEKYGFEVKYPDEWTIKIYKEDVIAPRFIDIDGKAVVDNGPYNPPSYQYDKPLEQIVNKELGYNLMGVLDAKILSQEKIGGRDTALYTESEIRLGDGTLSKEIRADFLLPSNKIVLFALRDSRHKEVFRQMLLTFKHIK